MVSEHRRRRIPLVITDEKAPWTVWDDKANWRQGQLANGFPASGSPALKAWKTSNFTAPELALVAVSGDDADPDHDGQSNIGEFLSGTDPRDARSFFKVESAEIVPGAEVVLKIRFPAAAGKSYSVQSADSLSKPAWTSLTNIAAQPNQGTVEIAQPIPPTQRSRYYRVVTPAPPSP